MQRREFLAASAAAALGLAATSGMSRAADAPAASAQQVIELRVYHFASAAKMQAYEEFLAAAGIPALNRAGVAPVGVLKMLAKDNAPLKLAEDSTDLYVVLPFKSFEAFASLEQTLAKDSDYQKAGAAILNDPQKDSAYTRYESTVMLGFKDCPKVEVPTKAETRLMQLRIYPSHNNERALKKIAMFNKEGDEIGIFKRCGMNPVFFGQALAGANLPNLTYMLAFENEEVQKKGWAAFRGDPDWKRISTAEEYKDTVIGPKILNMVLRPAKGSQI